MTPRNPDVLGQGLNRRSLIAAHLERTHQGQSGEIGYALGSKYHLTDAASPTGDPVPPKLTRS